MGNFCYTELVTSVYCYRENKRKRRTNYAFGNYRSDFVHGGFLDDLQEDGPPGLEGIVPIYSTYVLCKVLYGNGWKFLLLLIPFYNIYFAIKMMVDLAKAFNQGVGFAIGLLLLPFVFNLILAFGGAQYMDGSFANTQPDMVEDVVNKARDAVSGDQNDR